MKQSTILFLMVFFVAGSAAAQTNDTIIITPKDVNTNVLKEGEHRYLVYFKMAPGATRTNTNFWTRKIERTTTNGKPTITVRQQWEDKDTIMHATTSVSDAVTMQTISHESWWKGRGSADVDFEKRLLKINGQVVTDADTAKRTVASLNAFKSTDGQFSLNWHLDLEVFPTMPFKKGRVFLIPFYDPGTPLALDKVAYTVTGSEIIIGYDNQKIDCWIMIHETKGNKEKFYISKKTKEVLKLEQEINGKMWRYKIKMPFSN
ncbi:MAG: hypothetical protein EOP00_25545 [Pedobacter sp.]|nr:MAG: hypothetical protein EOP00_25545 [Pedobacter sp.]